MSRPVRARRLVASRRPEQPRHQPGRPDPSSRCHLLHVDMDAFYASVATRDRADLRAVPVIVGGGHRGVVLSPNYRAREFGVRSAMPMTRARRLCPEAVVVAPDFALFETVSASVMETFARVTPAVEALSLDEAFLDVAGTARRLGTPYAVAEHLRAVIHDEQGITCSVGVAASASVAKLAGRRAKPDGVVVVPPGAVTGFLHPLPVGELWGVGEKTAEQLARLGLVTVGDLAHTPVATLQRALGTHAGAHLHRLAWGEDERRVVAREDREDTAGPGGGVPGSEKGPGARPVGSSGKSIGSEETFGRDTDDPEVVLRELLRLGATVAGRMRGTGVVGRTVVLRVRFADFTTITRSRTLDEATDLTQELYRTGAALYAALGLQRARIRLVGLRVEGLRPRTAVDRQLVLGEREHGWSEADRAVDRAASRFGGTAVRPASLLLDRAGRGSPDR